MGKTMIDVYDGPMCIYGVFDHFRIELDKERFEVKVNVQWMKGFWKFAKMEFS